MEFSMNRKTLFNFLILITLMFIVLPSSAFCELKSLDDDGLSEVYAEGFAQFTIKDIGTDSLGNPLSQTEALFNIRADTYTEVDSLKLGYHNEYDYKDPTPAYAWDEDWVNVQIGKIEATALSDDAGFFDPTEDFIADGLYFRAEFTNINNSATRQLKTFAFGVKHAQGDIKAVFNQFSGTINDGAGAPEYNGHDLNLGPVTITSDPTGSGTGGFEISLSIDTYDKGYWVTFDNAIVTP
jgi:hypothetical protein